MSNMYNGQPMYNNMPSYNAQPTYNNQPDYNPNMYQGKKSKAPLIVGIILLLAVAGGLLYFFVFRDAEPSAKKILTCSKTIASIGVYGEEEYKFYINDGSCSIIYSKKIDLSKMDAETYDDEWANELIKDAEEACKSEGCILKHSYSKNKSLELTAKYDSKAVEKLISSDLKDYTSDEIYDQIKEASTSSYYTCK